MREVNVDIVRKKISQSCVTANKVLPDDIKLKITASKKAETSETALSVLEMLEKNTDVASCEQLPVCQDTGFVTVFARIGQDVHFIGGSLTEAINRGVASGYVDGFLRLSVVKDPLRRVNTGDNTPCVIYTEIVPGDGAEFTVMPKGFGSENMSKQKMFTPAATKDDIVDFVVETVKTAGSNPCPPVIVGVGIGGTFDYSAVLAKKALAKSIDVPNDDEFYASLEKEMLDKINMLNIGPQGFGGKTTALGVNIEAYPTHIAGLPVAVNIGCHVTRHFTFTV